MGVGDKIAREIAQGLFSYLPDAGKAVDAVQARGAQILNMLQAGQGSKITNEMLDLGDLTANARLNEYLYRNYDLPMDEASRMARAREMGFDTGTPLYHGTGADFQVFEPSSGTYGDAVYMTKNADDAGSYAERRAARRGGQPSIMPLVRAGQAISPYGLEKLEARAIREGAPRGRAAFNAAQQKAQDLGFVGVDDARTGYATSFKPANIRSRFARFDPRLAHLSNLSAATAAGLPLGLLSMTADGERQ